MDYQDKLNLYKCRKTVLEMLADRAYPVPENFNIGFQDFALLLEQNNLDLYLIKDEKDAIYVRFLYDYNKNLTKKDLDLMMEEIQGEKTNNPDINMIFILKINPSKNNMEMLEKIHNVEIFWQDQLTFNPTKHFLVPKHIPLTNEEVEEVLKKYKCKKSQLPKLSTSDVIAKYYGMKPDSVFKIIRNSSSMGEHIYYRHVK
jgi:DNA-directed RNA polymerase I, II, and III subunit RPABC1